MTEVTLKGRLNAIQRFASFCHQRIPARKLGAFAPFCESMKKAAEDLRAAAEDLYDTSAYGHYERVFKLSGECVAFHLLLFSFW
jgi:hypothetical protein